MTWSNAPPDDPALDLFMEPRLLHAVDRPGIMFRVVDVPNALLGRGYSGGAGSVTLRVVEDTLAPWNAGWWRLSVGEGGEPRASSCLRRMLLGRRCSPLTLSASWACSSS